MPSIRFKGDTLVVKQVQRSLDLDDDGIDGTTTWNRIARRFDVHPLLPIKPLKQIDDVLVENLKADVQEALGDIEVDGMDGQETWSALAEHFDPKGEHLDKELIKTPVLTSGKTKFVGITPNKGYGHNKCQGIVIHHASGYYEGTISWCMNPVSKVSYHALISLTGDTAMMAYDDTVCWHAGVSSFKGKSNCNSFLMGLSFTGNTNDGAMRGPHGPHLTDAEVNAAVEYLKPRMKKYGWSKHDIVTHRTIAPRRKDDVSNYALSQILDSL